MKIPGSDLLFGLPVVLDTNRPDLVPGKKVCHWRLPSTRPIALRGSHPGLLYIHAHAPRPPPQVTLTFQGVPLAVMEIESRWHPNKAVECKKSYGFTTLEVASRLPR